MTTPTIHTMRIDELSQRTSQMGLTQGAVMQKPTDTTETSNSAGSESRSGFGKILEQTNESRQVKAGDTLIGIVREQAQLKGLQLNGSQEYQWARSLANQNGIANPNRIYPGQTIQLGEIQAKLSESSLTQTKQNTSAAMPTALALAQRGVLFSMAPKPLGITPSTNTSNALNGASSPISPLINAASTSATPNPVLNQTLDRAVARGFVPLGQRQDVYNKILQVADKHQFAPDDFARLTLMESDGMNPVATNQRCHGIIQFCDGPSRGAASVGWGQAPQNILRLSVLQQLQLVDTYFDKVGLKKDRPVTLDELYLAVLQPAARSETRPEAPLGIPGKQARHLYEGQNPKAPMTRISIVQGLVQNAIERLSGTVKQPQIEARNTADFDTLNSKRHWIR